MNIFRREWAANRKGLIIWSIAIGLLSGLLITVFPSIAENKAKMMELMDTYPDALKKAFNLDLDMTNILGYYAMQLYLFVALFGSIYAAMLGSGMLAKEENEKTIEFLLAKPVSRSQIVWNKALCYTVNIVIFNLFVSVVNWIGFESVKTSDYSFKTFVWLSVAPLLIHLTFAALGMLASVFIVRRRTVTTLAIGIVLVGYFLSVAADVTDSLNFLGYISPFGYGKAAEIVKGTVSMPPNAAILLAVSAAALGLSVWLYRRKDISV